MRPRVWRHWIADVAIAVALYPFQIIGAAWLGAKLLYARIRRLLVIALLAWSGCGDMSGPEPSAEYRLVQLVGQPVPGAAVTLSGGERVVVAAGVLELRSDGRYVDTLTVCTEDGCRDERSGGRYESGEGEVLFWPDGSEGGSAATVTDGVLVWNASVYVQIE